MAATISEAVQWWAAQTPQRVAFAMSGDRLSYAALNNWVDNTAHWLTQKNVVPGDRVAVLGSNSLAWWLSTSQPRPMFEAAAIVIP